MAVPSGVRICVYGCLLGSPLSSPQDKSPNGKAEREAQASDGSAHYEQDPGTTGSVHGNYSKRQETRKTRHQDKSKQAIAWRSRLYMPPRTKTAHSTTTAGNEAPDTTGTSPRRSARFAPALTPTLPVASTSRVHVHALPATPAGQRILRPASARRLSAKAQAGDAPPSPAQRGKRKSPDVHGGEREDVRTKRARVRCPAEATPTRKGKSKASSPSSRSSPDTQHDSPTSTHTRTQKSTPAKNAHGQSGRTTRRTGRVGTSSAAPNASSSSRTPRANPMTLRSATPSSASHPSPSPHPSSSRAAGAGARHVRGSSPAPGRLDEIDMGLVVESSAGESAPPSPKLSPNLGTPKLGLTTALGGMQGSPLSSPLTSPARERGEVLGAALAPWEREREVKKEPTEMEGVLPRSEEKEKEGAKRDEDVEMGMLAFSSGASTDLFGVGQEQHQEGDAASPSTTTLAAAPTVPNTNARSPTPSPTIAQTTPSSLSSSTAPPPLAHITTTSTSTSQPCSGRALSPEDLAPSPFAPPALPLPLPSTPSADELSNLALAPPPAPLGLSLGHGLGAGHGHGHAPELDLGLSLGLGLGTPDALGGIAPGPPVSPDWPLPHAPFALAESSSSSSSAGGSSGPGMYAPFAAPYPASSPSAFTDAFGAPFASTSAAPAAAYPYQHQHPHQHQQQHQQHQHPQHPPSPAERQTRAVEWGALIQRRRAAGERALLDAREAEERRRERERWEGQWGLPPGRGAPVWWGARVREDRGRERRDSRSRAPSQEEGQDVEMGEQQERTPEKSDGADVDADGDADADAEHDPDADADAEHDSDEDAEEDSPPGGYAPEDAYAEEEYGRMRRRSPLCIVSPFPAKGKGQTMGPPSPLVLDPPSPAPAQQQEQQQEQEQHPQEPRTDLVYAVEPLYPPASNASNSHSHNPNSASQQDGNESDGASPEPETEEEMAAAKKAKEDADMGPDPATRMNMGWGPWKIACRMRVWDVRQRYTPSLIRSLVAQETDDYFSSRGLPHPDALLFMDEEYYDWELESASEGDGSADGSGEDGEGRELRPRAAAAGVCARDDARHENGGGGEGGGEMDMDLGSGMGGALSSFYVAPPPAHLLQGGPGPFAQMPLPLPPPPLASVRVPALRHLFTDIPIAPAAGAARGRGTPVDPARKAAWSGRGDDAVGMGVGRGKGTLERRLPHPRPRPHPMYLAMARAVEMQSEMAGPYGGGDGVGGGSRVEGVPDEEVPPLPRLREEGEPPMLPMRGLRELVRSLRGAGEEDPDEAGTEEERRDQERREMSEAFEPDEAVWQEFLKSVGVEGGAAASGSGSEQRDGDAMDVDADSAQGSVDANADYDDEESGGGGGGTSGGVALGLPSASTPSSAGASSSGGSMVGMGVEMGIGMFGMAMGAMGLGWFGGSPSPPAPVPVAVGDVGGVSVGERERERESSLSYALGV
ncbi:hypothetical protein B0H14DRAFT_3174046 [Mycena olivaceomarginata]|nr:hypothetical protein B0H14DRAFT_3174046 [Mycena olivaceomarginata]